MPCSFPGRKAPGETRMIEKKDLFHIGYYDYGQAFTGSFRGMRYRLARDPLVRVRTKEENRGEKVCLMVYVWPEPYGFEATSREKILQWGFPYTEAGLEDSCRWLNEMYEKRFKKERDNP